MRYTTIALFTIVFGIGCGLTPGQTSGSSDAAMLALLASAGNSNGNGGGQSGNQAINLLVSSASPTGVQTGSSVNVVVTFSEAANTTSVQNAFTVNDGTSNLAGSFTWSNSNQTVTWSGTETAYKTHTVSIATSATNASGSKPLASTYSFTFHVGPFTANSGLYWQTGNAGSAPFGSNCALAPTCKHAEASTYCTSIGMRLPTITEWDNARSTISVTIQNPSGGAPNTLYYWTSDVDSSGTGIGAGPTEGTLITNGWVSVDGFNGYEKDWSSGSTVSLYVRCVM